MVGTKFQLEILIRRTISAKHKFREDVLESSRNVSETTPRTSKVRDWRYKCPNMNPIEPLCSQMVVHIPDMDNPATMAAQLRVAMQQAWDVLRPVGLRTLVQSRVKSLLSLCLLLHCGIEGDAIVDQLAKGTLDHDIDPLTTVRYEDLKPMVNSYFQQEVQIKWDVSLPWICYEKNLSGFYLSVWNQLVFNQRLQSCLFSHHSCIYWFLPEETKCVFPTYW